jgi:hypothetical protein
MSKTGRNDPCPCGSGRKYKLCCGALRLAPAPTQPPAAAGSVASAADGAQSPSRPCGSCTRCCDGWLEGEIRGHPMFPGRRCHFAGDGACTIYDERPQSPCRSFVCGWAQPGSPLPDDWRPDRVGVIVVTTRWRDAPALILVSAGKDPDEAMLDRLREHASRTGTPFFYAQNGERFGYGPPAFQYEMAAKVARGDKLW